MDDLITTIKAWAALWGIRRRASGHQVTQTQIDIYVKTCREKLQDGLQRLTAPGEEQGGGA